VDLGAVNQIDAAHASYDFVYYELFTGFGIQLDWVVVDVGTTPAGPWYEVFNWYNGSVDLNTNIGALGHGSSGEPDNYNIPAADLWSSSGITIDITGIAPPGMYQYIRIFSPLLGGNDGSDVDSLQVLP
jgi:hypothetical protein